MKCYRCGNEMTFHKFNPFEQDLWPWSWAGKRDSWLCECGIMSFEISEDLELSQNDEPA